jgi:hypothetical protein
MEDEEEEDDEERSSCFGTSLFVSFKLNSSDCCGASAGETVSPDEMLVPLVSKLATPSSLLVLLEILG